MALPIWAGRFLVCSLHDGRVLVWGAFHDLDWLAHAHAVYVRQSVGPVWIEEQGRPAAVEMLPRTFISWKR